MLNVSECCWYDHSLRFEWSRSVVFQSPRWLKTQSDFEHLFSHITCDKDSWSTHLYIYISFCIFYPIMLIWNLFYFLFIVQHFTNSRPQRLFMQLPFTRSTRDWRRQRQFSRWSLRAKTARGDGGVVRLGWFQATKGAWEPILGIITLQKAQSLWRNLEKHSKIH